MPALDPVTQRFIADVNPYIDAMDRLVAATEIARAEVEKLQRAIDELPLAKTVTIAVKTVGGAGDTGLGGMAAQAQAASQAVEGLSVVWTEEAAAQAAAAAAAGARAREEAAAAAATAADAAATRGLNDRLAEATATIARFGRYAQMRAEAGRTEDAIIAQEAQTVRTDADAWDALRGTLQRAYAQVDQTKVAMEGLRTTLQTADVQVAANEQEVRRLAQAFRDAPQTITRTADAATRAGVGFRFWGIGMALTRTALHWIVAGAAEFLAVAVPATIALGAGLAVAAQGAQMAYIHMSALYNTMEAVGPAVGKTAGDVLGLGHSLQWAQDQANPGVYEVLGSVVNDMKTHFADLAGAGLRVVHMFDEFAARVTVDLQGRVGAQLHDLLSAMVTDLSQFGQVLGNLGHALLNFAAAMPGLAQVLLSLLDGASRLLLAFSSLPAVLITVAMGLEEFYRWGGLALSAIARLAGGLGTLNAMAAGGGFIVRFGAALGAIAGQVGLAVGALGRWLVAVGDAQGVTGALGFAMKGLGQDMVGLTYASPKMLAAFALIPASMAIAAVAFDHVRNSSQKLIDATNQAVRNAPTMGQAMAALATGSAKAAVALGQQEQVLHSYPGYLQASGGAAASLVTSLEHLSGPLGGAEQGMINAASHTNFFTRALGQAANQLIPFTSIFHFFSAGAASAASQVDQLKVAESQWAAEGASMITNAGTLATKFGVSLPAAFAMASAAGVNLIGVWQRNGAAMKIAEQQVQNFITGLGDMGAPAGKIGQDMSVLAIQAGLATTKVQQLNQAWDQMFSLVSGGIGNFAQLVQGIRQMQADAKSSSASLGGAFGSIRQGASGANSSVQTLHYTLKGLGPAATQSLQQVTQVMSAAEQQANFFQTALAAGAISNGQFNQSMKDLVGSMAKFAAGNPSVAASLDLIARRAGGPATTNIKKLAEWAGIHGPAALRALERQVNSTSVNLSHLGVVAQHLGTVMQGQMTAAFSSAVLKALNYNQAMQNLALTLKKYPADSAQAHAAIAKINAIQKEATTIGQKFGQLTKTNAGHLKDLGTAAKGATGSVGGLGGAVKQTHDDLVHQGIAAKTAALTTQGFGQQTQTAAGQSDHLRASAQQAAAQVKTLGSNAATTQGHLGDVNNEIRTNSTLSGPAAGKLSTLAGQIATVGSQASTAAGEVHALATAISGLQSKTITLTTNVVTVTSTVHRQHGGPVWPGQPFTVGEAGRELFVPAVPGFIVPHEQTERILSPVASPETAAAMSTVHLSASLPVTVSLDGQTVWQNMQQRTLVYNVRNGSPQSGRVAPGTPFG